jgi:hypothetical protein
LIIFAIDFRRCHYFIFAAYVFISLSAHAIFIISLMMPLYCFDYFAIIAFRFTLSFSHYYAMPLFSLIFADAIDTAIIDDYAISPPLIYGFSLLRCHII